jgi:hypothetical protein
MAQRDKMCAGPRGPRTAEIIQSFPRSGYALRHFDRGKWIASRDERMKEWRATFGVK